MKKIAKSTDRIIFALAIIVIYALCFFLMPFPITRIIALVPVVILLGIAISDAPTSNP